MTKWDLSQVYKARLLFNIGKLINAIYFLFFFFFFLGLHLGLMEVPRLGVESEL